MPLQSCSTCVSIWSCLSWEVAEVNLAGFTAVYLDDQGGASVDVESPQARVVCMLFGMGMATVAPGAGSGTFGQKHL